MEGWVGGFWGMIGVHDKIGAQAGQVKFWQIYFFDPQGAKR